MMTKRGVLDSVMALLFVACALAGTAEPLPAAEQAPPVMKAIVTVTHGNSSGDESVRRIGRGIPERGYNAFYAEFFPPLRELGFRRFAVWNPFGVNAREDMDADQALELRELLARPEADWKMRSLMSVEAWRSAAVEHVTSHGDELIAYNGALDQDKDFLAVRNDVIAWTARAVGSYRPYLQARASVAVDAGHDIRAGSIEHRWIELLRAGGVKVYLETYWWRGNPWTFDHPCIVVDRFYQKSIRDHPRGFTDTGWALPPEDVKAEVCRLVNHDPNETVEQRRERIKGIVADGHTPIIGAVDAAWYAAEVGY